MTQGTLSKRAYSHSKWVLLSLTLILLLSYITECCLAWNIDVNNATVRHVQDPDLNAFQCNVSSLHLVTSDTDDWPSEEYCNGEAFRPRCLGGKNDIIVTTSARFGRMKFGRCLEEEPELASMMQNPRFFGCWADVKFTIDQLCSGRSECDVRINDQSFDGVKPCYAHLKMFLEVSYMCVKVAAESRHCTVSLTSEPQHIVGGGRSSRLLNSDTVGCGTQSQAWSIETLAGQRIAVSLIEFDPHRNSSADTISCHPVYGYVIDGNTRKNVTLCRSISSDQSVFADESFRRTIYVSTSNQLQLVTREDIHYKFIIRVEAVGCSDLAPPSDEAWIKRIDNQLTVGCYMSRQSWHLNCVNGVWTGTVGVCNNDQSVKHDRSETNDDRLDHSTAIGKHSSMEMAALVAVASTGVTLCCLVICVGIICLRRQNKQTAEKSREHKYYNDIHLLATGSVSNA